MRRLLLGSLALILCGAAAPQKPFNTESDEALIAKQLVGLTPGKSRSCIPQYRAQYSTSAIGNTILYRVNRKLVYRNDTTGGCNDRQNVRALVSTNYGPGLCSGQIIQSVDLQLGFNGGACALRDFVPYTAK